VHLRCAIECAGCICSSTHLTVILSFHPHLPTLDVPLHKCCWCPLHHLLTAHNGTYGCRLCPFIVFAGNASGQFGADARYITAAVQRVLRTYSVDLSRISLVGFSDGATYALDPGTPTGTRLPYTSMAFSPGDMAPPSVVSSWLC